MSDLQRQLHAAVDAGLVSRRTRGDLAIYCYTPDCSRKRAWTETTRAARGLILHEPTGGVVARPFRKFFNMDETEETAEGALPWSESFEITEKIDGSLGILFCFNGLWDIATKGAFESEQAVYAREELLPKYDLSSVAQYLTVLVEIVYPENRIVVDYGAEKSLRIIGAIERDRGVEIDRRLAVAIGRMTGMPAVLQLDQRPEAHPPNTEGYVLHWRSRGLRVKIKAPDYVAAHRCLDMVRPRRVLELMVEGRDDDVLEQLPAHVRGQFEEIRAKLGIEVSEMCDRARFYHAEHDYKLRESRKAFALSLAQVDKALRPLIFALADGKGSAEIEKMARNIVGKNLPKEAP